MMDEATLRQSDPAQLRALLTVEAYVRGLVKRV